MRRECRERFPRHRLQRKPLVSDPGMHDGTCITHAPSSMSRSLTRGGGEKVPGIPGASATSNFTYLARGPWRPSPTGALSYDQSHRTPSKIGCDKWNMSAPDLQMACSCLNKAIGYQNSSPNIGRKATCPNVLSGPPWDTWYSWDHFY